CLVPIPDRLALRRAVGLFAVLHQVIEQRAMSATARYTTPYASGVVLASEVRCPVGAALEVLGDRHTREDRLVFLRVEQVAHLPAVETGQLAAIGGVYEVVLWVLAQIPGGKANRAVDALAVSWRHQHHQALDLSSGYALERPDHVGVVPSGRLVRE